MKKQTKMESQENRMLPEIKKVVHPILLAAQNLEVSDQKEYTEALIGLRKLKVVRERIETEKSKMLTPLKEAVKVENDRWKPFEKILSDAEDLYKTKMSIFVAQDQERVKIEEQKILKKFKKPESQWEQISNIAPSMKEGTRKIKELIITDQSLIPREYMTPDLTRIKEAMKEGVIIPGCKYEDKIIIVNS